MSTFVLFLISSNHLFQRVISQNINCDLANECVGTSYDTLTFINFNGYQSGFGATTSWIGGSTQCRGQSSCAQMAFMQTDNGYIACEGALSCYNTTFTGKAISIRGAFAGSYTTFIYDPNWDSSSTKFLECSALQSCSYTTINKMPTVTAYASYSLYKATFNTQNTDNIKDFTLHLYASYAAYGAKMQCRNAQTCTINCYSATACFNFYIDCVGECTFNTFFNGQNTTAPITDLAEFDSIALISPIFNYITDNEVLCSTSDTAFLADDFRQYQGDQSIILSSSGPICCRGRSSCREIKQPYVGYETVTGNSVICSAQSACAESAINSNKGKVFCSARLGCDRAMITNTDIVYCTGKSSCELTTFSDVHYVICGGYESCMTTTFISNGIDLHLNLTGYQSAKNSYLYCNSSDVCIIGCDGFDTCSTLSIFCYGTCFVECNVWSGCPFTTTLGPTQTLNTSPLSTKQQTSLFNTSTRFTTTYTQATNIQATNTQATYTQATQTQASVHDVTIQTSLKTTPKYRHASNSAHIYMRIMIVIIVSIFILFCAIVIIWLVRKKKKNLKEFERMQKKIAHIIMEEHACTVIEPTKSVQSVKHDTKAVESINDDETITSSHVIQEHDGQNPLAEGRRHETIENPNIASDEFIVCDEDDDRMETNTKGNNY